MTPAQAYHVASQYGSYMNSGDPGRCFYSFYAGDARPSSEAHRQDCIAYAQEQHDRLKTGMAMSDLSPVYEDPERDLADLAELVEFFKTTELHPWAEVDEAA